MTVLENLKVPESLTMHLKTLTPLYTGGIGQYGEQIHPSGLLGSIRHFSSLLAAAIGDSDFETRVWGTTTQENHQNVHAKKVALRWDVSGLETVELDKKITWQDEQHQHRGWYYNVAQKGSITLTLTQRGISETDWQLLKLALRIQIIHATLGAKDQFGLGVVTTDKLPEVQPLSDQMLRETLTDRPSLHNAFFAEIQFPCTAPKTLHQRIEAGLRHYLFGDLKDKWGSAINVSAIYPLANNQSALRIWGVLPHTRQIKKSFRIFNQIVSQREEILTRIKTALNNGPLSTQKDIKWTECSQENIVAWINQLNLLSNPTTVQQPKRKVIKRRIS
ncbi:hypothetical protein PN36_34165 [Candidatus Thiomargarita nelsonii]|uniref:CRISPR type III-associated protein domain-containing protein n=1 Tax=Candidatus Thiomargarita nelsonii TaxID=1003181 RepID=A0A0A6P9E3_9GAMM|nr:hypothetical protein PN36_34165 [Candidatus Thiomargarita nelsonii]